LLTWANWHPQFLMVIRWDWYNGTSWRVSNPVHSLWTYLVEVFVVRWILDSKLVFCFNSIVIGDKIEIKYFDWIILSGRGAEGVGFWKEQRAERVGLPVHGVVEPLSLSTSLLTNQQFIVYQLRLPREHLILYAPLPCAYPCTRE
jgi:hypothetical protein